MANTISKAKANSLIKALEKNEYGQYIIPEDLNKMDRGAIWAYTDHPCKKGDGLECLDCPYTECICTCAQITGTGSWNGQGYDGIQGKKENPLPRGAYNGKNPQVKRGIVKAMYED
jgi:hypothetical protein